MRRSLSRVTAVFALATSIVLVADEFSVTADPRADFSRFKTFEFRDRKVESGRAELNNRLFIKKLETTIREAMVERGLTHSPGHADLLIDFSLVGDDHTTTARGSFRGQGPQPVRFTEGTLVIDMFRPAETDPVWRGVYRDDEQTGSKLVQKLPQDARKLIDRYPRLRK